MIKPKLYYCLNFAHGNSTVNNTGNINWYMSRVIYDRS